MIDARTADLFDNGIPGRDKGMAVALEHAESLIPKWGDLAYDVLKFFAAKREQWITAELRIYATEIGLPKPPTNWAWGSVVVRAIKNGIIVQNGTAKFGAGRNHQKLCPVWRKK